MHEEKREALRWRQNHDKKHEEYWTVKELLASAESVAAANSAGLARDAEDLRNELRAMESELAETADSSDRLRAESAGARTAELTYKNELTQTVSLLEEDAAASEREYQRLMDEREKMQQELVRLQEDPVIAGGIRMLKKTERALLSPTPSASLDRY